MQNLILTNWVGEKGLPSAVSKIQEFKSALDAIQAGVVAVEKDPLVPHVGLGGLPNMLGQLETDAAIMDGNTLRSAAVGALKGYTSAITLARHVYDKLPHTTIVGEGAAMLAKECGLETVTEHPQIVNECYQNWFAENISEKDQKLWPEVNLSEYSWPKPDLKDEKDTVIYLTKTSTGQIAAATSTSGWGFKYPGRLGDSPIVGAGLYADSKFGACACTHTGEMTTRASTSRSVVLYLKTGMSLQDACHEAVNDLRRLKGGYLGPVVIHSIDKNGDHYVVSTTKGEGKYFIWQEQSGEIQAMDPVVDEIVF